MPKSNKKDQVIEALQMLARVGRVRRENRFKIRAFENAVQSIESFPDDFLKLYSSGNIKKMPGIGKGIYNIIEAVVCGKTLEEFFPDFPIDIIELAENFGLKRAEKLKKVGITTLDQLKNAAQEGQLELIEGFGKITQEKLKAGFVKPPYKPRIFGQVRLDQALIEAHKIIKGLLKNNIIHDATLVGNLRRGLEIIDAIDILIISNVSLSELEELLKIMGIVQISRLRKTFSGVTGKTQLGIVLNVYRATKKNKGMAQILLTGSEDFIQKLLRHNKTSIKDLKTLDAENEELAFKKLDLANIAPERREKSVILKSNKRSYPRLIELKDLQGIFHNHTYASDGKNSVLEMQRAASQKGLRYISINDHSQSAFYAGGQSKEALLNQLELIKQLNQCELAKSCHILSGVESDIRLNGSLDYEARVLRKLEIIVASVHSQLKMPFADMTQRMLKAALNPFTTIMGHPTGRLLFKRSESVFDMEILIDACKKNHVALELNCQPARLDLNERYLSMAKEQGVLIAIDADAHSTHELNFLEYGIIIARRSGLTADDVLNTFSLEDLRLWLKLRSSQ